MLCVWSTNAKAFATRPTTSGFAFFFLHFETVGREHAARIVVVSLKLPHVTCAHKPAEDLFCI